MEKKLNDLIDKALSRRTFMAGAGTAAAAALIVGCNNGMTPTPTPTPPIPPLDIPDNDILNFALNLEYLEAEFYLYATTGQGLSTADALSGAGTTKVPANIAAVPWANASYAQYANEIAQDELNHVRYIQRRHHKPQGNPGSSSEP